eukprot:5637372-Amphidinium_carterae.1
MLLELIAFLSICTVLVVGSVFLGNQKFLDKLVKTFYLEQDKLLTDLAMRLKTDSAIDQKLEKDRLGSLDAILTIFLSPKVYVRSILLAIY